MSWITGGGGGGNTVEAKAYTDTQVNILKDGVDSTGDTLKKLRNLITAIQTLLNSNDANLDTLQEVVTYIKNNATVLEGVTINKVNTADIVDDLVHTDTNKPLSANQGRALKALIDALTAVVDAKGDMFKSTYDTDGDGKVDKAVQADNATKLNNHTASATPGTTEQVDLVGMVNEVDAKVVTKANQDYVEKINNKIDIFFGKRIINGVTPNSGSKHISIYDYTKAFNGKYRFDTLGEGWLALGTETLPWIKFNMPIGVVIGDSVSAGNNQLFGRLSNSNGQVDLSLQNYPGQFSYHLEQYTRCKVYNHGIGGQRADQVRLRWNRDVLAQTVSSLNPTSTLPKIPSFVLINVGVNDVAANRTEEAIKEDFQFFIDSCNENNIYCIINTINPANVLTVSQITTMKNMNTWLKSKETTNIKVIDTYSIMNDSNNDGHPLSEYVSDGTHPVKWVYQELSKKIINEAFTEANTPVVPRYINFSTDFDFTNLVNDTDRPTSIGIYINDIPALFTRLPNCKDQNVKIPKCDTFIDTIKIEIITHESAIENPGTGYSTGFAEIYLTDRDEFKENYKYNDSSNIILMPCPTEGINDSFPAVFANTNDGNVACVTIDNALNVAGIFIGATITPNTNVCVGGICKAYVIGDVKEGDLLTTKGSNNCFIKNYTPIAGSVVAKVLKARSGEGITLVKLITQ